MAVIHHLWMPSAEEDDGTGPDAHVSSGRPLITNLEHGRRTAEQCSCYILNICQVWETSESVSRQTDEHSILPQQCYCFHPLR